MSSLDAVVVDLVEPALGEEATATFSPDRTYRYALTRRWRADLPVAAFLMLNPSTADAFVLDPTVRRCIGFARAWNTGGVLVLNLFGLRASNPSALYDHPVLDAAVRAVAYLEPLQAHQGVLQPAVPVDAVRDPAHAACWRTPRAKTVRPPSRMTGTGSAARRVRRPRSGWLPETAPGPAAADYLSRSRSGR